MSHVYCGCVPCRISAATKVAELVELTPEQYVRIIQEGLLGEDA